MEPLDQRTLEVLADMICHDGGYSDYGQVHEISKFFRAAGIECPDSPESIIKSSWALKRLEEFNKDSSKIQKVILRLANPKEYQGDYKALDNSIIRLNKILAAEGMKVALEGISPQIKFVQPYIPFPAYIPFPESKEDDEASREKHPVGWENGIEEHNLNNELELYMDKEEIGVGGFGVVYKSTRKDDGKVFAKKIISEHSDDYWNQRFRREIVLLEKMDHPNIIKVIDKNIVQKPYYYIMPLCEGNLNELIPKLRNDKEGRQKVKNQILHAVEYAHNQKIIHRDLKPSNILFDKNHNIVISDFGLGRKVDSPSTRRTSTNEGFGTEYYTAPEQRNNAKNADIRSDIFSLGMIIYKINTEKEPAAQLDFSNIDSGIKYIIEKCTKYKPEERYQTVSEIRKDFKSIAQKTESKESKKQYSNPSKEIIMKHDPSDEEINDFHLFLLHLRDDPDIIHKVFMSATPGAFVKYHSNYPGFLRSLIKNFTQNIIESHWHFYYCDKIALKIKDLFNATSDAEIRILMLISLLELGVNHNRWFVIDTFVTLIESLENPGEIIQVVDALESSNSLIHFKDRLLNASIPLPIHQLVSELGNSDEMQSK
ncbi:MAG: serine/threonine protein kinase [Candidatus Eremiobacteraeota bacterium]|nr:serine/threonine protein kinase [Candidatus Eremiobacteraeota bacterium]